MQCRQDSPWTETAAVESKMLPKKAEKVAKLCKSCVSPSIFRFPVGNGFCEIEKVSWVLGETCDICDQILHGQRPSGLGDLLAKRAYVLIKHIGHTLLTAGGILFSDGCRR